MNVASAFQTFLDNIKIDNAETISLRYGEVTAALNKTFRDTESKTANSLQVGSYGRWTAIKGVSDLDMLYLMPARAWDGYNVQGGQSKLLSAAAEAIRARYPKTEVKVDRLVVCVRYKDFHIEVQPVFAQDDGSFKYPDAYDGGSWKITKPVAELDAMATVNDAKNGNLRRLCKMARAWKNKHGVGMGGLLIDTLAHNFLQSTTDYDTKSLGAYHHLSRDFFKYLSERPDQDYYAALGSGQRVKVKKNFQKKATKAHKLCEAALAAAGTAGESEKWRKLYGRGFPLELAEEVAKAYVAMDQHRALNTEEFIEDKFPIDIRHDIELDCEVVQNGFRPASLSEMLAKRVFLKANKSLDFHIKAHDIPGDFSLYWKVKNRGAEAVRRDMIRGQIAADAGQRRKSETTTFRGDHVVECYAVKNGVVIAKDRIRVPITEDA
jgi:hypothetical protein